MHAYQDPSLVPSPTIKAKDRLQYPCKASRGLNFARCEDVETAAAVKEAVKVQWSAFIFPGQKVKVKVNDGTEGEGE